MTQVILPVCSEFALLAVYSQSQLRLSKFVKEHFKCASSFIFVESDDRHREPDDFSYSCAAVDKISTDSARRAVPLRQLSFLLRFVVTTDSTYRVYNTPAIDCLCNWPVQLQLTSTLRGQGHNVLSSMIVREVEDCHRGREQSLRTPSLVTSRGRSSRTPSLVTKIEDSPRGPHPW